MEIKPNKPTEGTEPRRFSVGRATAKPGASSFAAALKKAASGTEATPTGAHGPADPAPAPSDPPPLAGATAAINAANPAPQTDGQPAPPEEASAADSDAAFADHMDLVRFRLKTGYYASKAINDALTDKLSGYFDELA